MTIRPPRAVLAMALVVLGLGASRAQSWEFKVCAEPGNLPFSNRQGEGFENRIAELIADELGAELSYAWLPRPTSRYREIYLRGGRCDAVMGIADGHEGFLTSLAYYRSSYVFVYPSSSGLNLDSLDDPALGQLRVAVAGGGRTGPERLALAERGLVERQLLLSADFTRPDPHSGLIEAVVEGRADLAIAWGPIAGFAAKRAGVPLELVPVSPPLGGAFLPMVIPISIGVRPHDEALQELINAAVAGSWEEIQSVLQAYGVPLEPLPRPALADQDAEADPLRVGVILPAPTGDVPLAEEPDAAAAAALQGAVMAGEDLLRTSMTPGFEVLRSSAPGAEAAHRAAERLVLADGAFALIGGLGEDQAAELQRVAQEQDVLFFNVGAAAQELRSRKSSNTFHLEASAAMYLEAIAESFGRSGVRDWYLVHGKAEAGLEVQARRAIEASRGVVVGSAPASVSDFPTVLEHVRAASPDAVLLLLDWRAQLEFIGLFDAFGLEPLVTGMPFPSTQTRNFYLALERTSVEADSLRRVTLWEPGLDADGVAELAEHYFGRWGLPMESPAWAGYQAVSILHRAATATKSTDSAELVAFLEREDTTFEVAKGRPVRFDAQEHQLRQPLYLIRLRPEGHRLGQTEAVIEEADP